MKKTFIVSSFALSIFSMVACNSTEKKDNNDSQVKSSIETNKVSDYDSVHHVVWNENSYTTQLSMKEGKNLYVNLEISDESKTIRARVVPEEAGSKIQIAQIIYPDGNKYGPFETTMEVDIKEKGNYQFIISQAKPINLPYNGTLRMEVQKR